MRWRPVVGLVIAMAAGAAAIVGFGRRARPPSPPPAPVASVVETDAAAPDQTESEDDSPTLRPPTGKLASLRCEEAGTIVREVQRELAFAAPPPPAKEFASTTKDWLDPHGHWAVAKDAPPFAEIDADAPALLAEIARGRDCSAALRIGHGLAAWIDSERARFDARSKIARGDARRSVASAVASAVEGAVEGAVKGAVEGAIDDGGNDSARAITDDLADRAGTLQRAYGAPIARYVATARDRFFPQMTDDAWSEVVLAAAVRAWVQLVDAHGAWAPYGEEASVHDVDLDEDAPVRLWTRATRTVLGVRIDDGAAPPLATGDVLLEVDGMPLAGLPIEQLDELALTAGASAGDGTEPFDVVLLRAGDREPRVVRVDPSAPEPATASSHPFELDAEMVPYGSGVVAVVSIPDIYDDLGDLVTRALTKAKSSKLAGIVLDLRGDGGGSTEGAIDTLGAFLPGARLFPMKSKDGTIETDRAPTPSPDHQWMGPVATLVDAGTASAAEMLSGALAAYRRGPSVGTPTYGKGCAQEYLDDDAHAGLLRVTTLLFALPDGSPVQRVGLRPTIAFPFVATDVGDDREIKLSRSPATWTGPDVRDAEWLQKSAEFAWPSAGARLGPCKEAAVCKALALLGDATVRGVTASRK